MDAEELQPQQHPHPNQPQQHNSAATVQNVNSNSSITNVLLEFQNNSREPSTPQHAAVTFGEEEAQQTVIFMEPNTDSKSSISTQSMIDKSLFNHFFLIRILEKIPLIVKLVLIVSFCLVPMVIFGALLINSAAASLNQSNEIKRLTTVTIHLSDIVNSLQDERGRTSLYLGYNKTKPYYDELVEARNRTDKAVNAFLSLSVQPSDILINDKVKRTFELFKDYLDKVTEYCKGLPQWRNAAANSITHETFIPTFQYINDWNGVTIDLIRIITSQSIDPTFSTIHNSFNLITSFKEYRGIRRFMGTIGVLNGSLYGEGLKKFTESKIRGRQLRQLFLLQISYEVYEEFDDRVLNNTQFYVCETMENYIMENHDQLTKYTVNEWYNNMTMCMDSLKQVEERMRIVLLDYSKQIGSKATDSLVAVTICIVLVILIAIFVALLFSKTIVGPWKKLLRLQEDTVYKFVPKEFMSIINKERVTDLRHGDYYEKELDVMFVDIRNYTALSERLPTGQMFKFLNRYLALVGPIVRRNFGYIDKYMGDGFIALFTEPGHALKASIEIQNCVRVFNESLSATIGPIAVGCGIVRGRCAVGLIGESKRMDPTIVGDSVNLSSRLESLTKYYGAKTLVSRTVTDSSVPLFDGEQQCWRSIGRVCVVGKKNGVEVMEVLPFDDCKKRSTKELFENAMLHLFSKDHFDPQSAESLLEQVAELDPDDSICKMRLLLAQSLVIDSSRWDFVDAPNTK